MLEILPESEGEFVAVRVSGKLHDADYKAFVPKAEAVIEREGGIRLLMLFEDFEGWDAHAAWDDFKFGVKNGRKIKRFALVGSHKWQEWCAKLCRVVMCESQFFDDSRADEAWKWVKE
jgi:hypothetical protein